MLLATPSVNFDRRLNDMPVRRTEVLPRMLFMVIEHFREGRAPDVYRRFRERGRMAPDGVSYVASWVDLQFTRCFQVMEADSEEALDRWIRNWDDLLDFEVVPVRTSSEAAAAIAPAL